LREFLPCTTREIHALGWDYVDVVLVTGDAYIDHPSFGIAIIGRWLEHHGYRAAVLSQPRHDSPEDFRKFGKPRLFFGISAGNLDSVVANYTGNARVRDRDMYSPGGNPYWGKERKKAARRRPDRACIRYTNLAKAAWPEVPVVLGGVEASLRRFIHYDYQQEQLRNSVLVDAKADILVYGMGERAVIEIARRLEEGRKLSLIPGTCERLTENHFLKGRPGFPVICFHLSTKFKGKERPFLMQNWKLTLIAVPVHQRCWCRNSEAACLCGKTFPLPRCEPKSLIKSMSFHAQGQHIHYLPRFLLMT